MGDRGRALRLAIGRVPDGYSEQLAPAVILGVADVGVDGRDVNIAVAGRGVSKIAPLLMALSKDVRQGRKGKGRGRRHTLSCIPS